MKLMTYFNAYLKARTESFSNMDSRLTDRYIKILLGLIKRLEKIDAENEEHATRLKWLFDDRDNWDTPEKDAEQGTDIRMCNECDEVIVSAYWNASNPFLRTLVCKNGHVTTIGE